MARTRTLAQLREEVRQRADMVNSGFVTNAEVDRCINQSWAQLYDRLLATGEDYYIKYVDMGPGGSTSTATSAYELEEASPQLDLLLSPSFVLGTTGWCVSTLGVCAIDVTTGNAVARLTLGSSAICNSGCYNGTQFVVADGSAQSIIGVNPTTPTPTVAFQTTAWSPVLGVTEGIGAFGGVLYDSATASYFAVLSDASLLQARLVKFTVVGTTATISATTPQYPLASVTDQSSLLYLRTGRVAVAIGSTFLEFDTSTLAVLTTVSGINAKTGVGVYDATTQRALLVSTFGVSPTYTVIDVAAASIVGTLDAAIVAAGGIAGLSFPTETPMGTWLVCSALGPPPYTTFAGAPAVIEVDPATLACESILNIPASVGLWAYIPSTGTLLAARALNLALGSSEATVLRFASQSSSTTAFADFENFTSSNGQPATDVYQVRGVDAVYGSNLIVNLPRYNWEERNLYNATPELTPYAPISAYRVIQNPVTGNDCIEFIPGTPNGVQYYRIWYYPNPKVLTADTDTLDGRSGWEEWVVVDAAMKLLAKEESDTSQLEREAQRVWARIMAVAENRDAGQSKRVTDVTLNSGAWPYPMGYPRRF